MWGKELFHSPMIRVLYHDMSLCLWTINFTCAFWLSPSLGVTGWLEWAWRPELDGFFSDIHCENLAGFKRQKSQRVQFPCLLGHLEVCISHSFIVSQKKFNYSSSFHILALVAVWVLARQFLLQKVVILCISLSVSPIWKAAICPVTSFPL